MLQKHGLTQAIQALSDLNISTHISGNHRVNLSFAILRNVLVTLFILRKTKQVFLQVRGRGIAGSVVQIYKSIASTVFGYFLAIPAVRSKVQGQVTDATVKLQSKLAPSGPEITRYLNLPKIGWTDEAVLGELEHLSALEHTRWEDGRVSGAVYHGEESLLDLQTQAYGAFTVSNPIHPDVFPGVRKMEAEIVAMVLSLFNAPLNAAGVSTSGGTESILMASLSAREKARVERGVTKPEMVIPETAHPAFRKACSYFGIKLQLVECPAPTYQVDISKLRRLINSNTVLLVGSAPNFPHGIMDDIESISKLAVKYKIPLHVDCCLGSFIVAFLEKSGFHAPIFDFRHLGVTSISCDTHKYGFAPKGSSICMYRTPELRAYQYFIDPSWSGGVYASPGVAGSRAGALIAGCWASMMSVGEDGYINSCKSIVGTAKRIARAIHEHPDLEILGSPIASVVAWTSSTLDIYDIADALTAKGWHLNSLQNPPAMHVAVTLPITKVQDKFLSDLFECVEDEKAKERDRIAAGAGAKGKSKGDSAALYGVAGSLPNKSIVVELTTVFLDTLYKA